MQLNEKVYLVIVSSARGDGEYVETIYRDPKDADEYKQEREQRFAHMSDDPPQFRIDERLLR